MKEFHILTVGNSLLSNFLKNKPEYRDVKMGDEDFWRRKQTDVSFFREVLDFLNQDPQRASAEINALLSYIQEREVQPYDITVYLSGTKTSSNEIVQRVLTEYFRTTGMEVLSPKEVAGLPISNLEDEVAEEFEKGLSQLLDTFIGLARKKKKEGYRVVFSPTGGYKPHVIACAFAGFLTQSELYYIHEEFKKLIIFRPLFYFPTHGETRLLEKLRDGRPRRSKEFAQIMKDYGREVDRLSNYGLVELETKPGEGAIGIKITSMGKWALEYYENMTSVEVKVK